jgi:hypothetical protein
LVHSAAGWLGRYSTGAGDTISSEPDADGAAELEGKMLKLGFGEPVGSGKRDAGKPRNDSANIRTKMATTARTQGRAMVSLRGGRAPRYPLGR